MSFFDLKKISEKGHTSLTMRKEMAYEFWKNNFFSVDGFPADVRISKMCRTVQRPLQDEKFLLLGSISLLGFCPANLSRKSPRYRILSESATTETISHGLSWPSFPQHLSQRQPSQGLAHLCRFCSSIDRHRPVSIRILVTDSSLGF